MHLPTACLNAQLCRRGAMNRSSSAIISCKNASKQQGDRYHDEEVPIINAMPDAKGQVDRYDGREACVVREFSRRQDAERSRPRRKRSQSIVVLYNLPNFLLRFLVRFLNFLSLCFFILAFLCLFTLISIIFGILLPKGLLIAAEFPPLFSRNFCCLVRILSKNGCFPTGTAEGSSTTTSTFPCCCEGNRTMGDEAARKVE